MGQMTGERPNEFMKTIEHNESKIRGVETILATKSFRGAAELVKDDFGKISFDVFQTIFVVACRRQHATHIGVLLHVMDLLGYSRDQIYTMAGLVTATDEDNQEIAMQANDLIFGLALHEQVERN